MNFIRNFNNNAALVSDKEGVEWVVVGKGVGFGRKTGEVVDDSLVEHKFVAADKNSPEIEEFKDIKPQALQLTTEVVKLIEPLLKLTYNDYQYFTLADHIDFALKCARDGIEIDNGTVRWEVRKLFTHEFQVAQKAVELIKKKTGMTFPDSEVVFLTYHFVNAESDGSKLQETIKISRLIAGIVEIVQYQYHITLDTESFNYNRFITHLRAMMAQQLSKSQSGGSELDPSLLELMRVKYPLAFSTVERIDAFLQEKAGWKLESDGKVYMALHIWRVTHRQKIE